jgi:hypothetical protein
MTSEKKPTHDFTHFTPSDISRALDYHRQEEQRKRMPKEIFDYFHNIEILRINIRHLKLLNK